MKEVKGLNVRLWEGDMRRREEANKNYLILRVITSRYSRIVKFYSRIFMQ